MKRNKLIEDNIHYAKKMAGYAFLRFSGAYPMDEIYASALFGLFKASRAYKKINGASFTTFAHNYIHGAIINDIRQKYPSRKNSKKKFTLEPLYDDTLIESSYERPDDFILDENLKRYFGNLIESFKERDKLLLALYFYENKTFLEISKIFDVSETRVREIYKRCIKTLEKLIGDKELFHLK